MPFIVVVVGDGGGSGACVRMCTNARVFMWITVIHEPKDQKREVDSTELGFQVVLDHHVDAGN